MTPIELLAPAKDLECGLAAINCGADAVYIGASRFGARENAGNDLADIATLVTHAHTYWAKVYVTLNTLLRDEELPHAVRLITQLYETGIDGLIIQDVGLLECNLPPIPLIASTQMHNHTPARVAFLEQVGFQRVILARELELAQIQAIRQQTKIELEAFVHGSLCVCYSGQCYLSYAIGGRSGNRGACAQPCRKSYSLMDGQGNVLAQDRHLLSLRDLNLSAHLRELVQAGVSSFKIEGRLKDRAYITNIVSHYRAHLDAVLQEDGLRKGSSGRSEIDFTPSPEKTFNRDFSSYFLHGRGETIASPDTPKMVGEPVGTVTGLLPRRFTLDGNVTLHNGDGICYYDAQDQLRGTVVNGVDGNAITPKVLEGIAPGMQIYRNHDHEFLAHLTKYEAARQIGVRMTVRKTRKGIEVIAVDEDATQVSCEFPCEFVLAEKPEVALANIAKQLGKMGGTAFRCDDVTIELSPVPFLPVSTLNALRRDVLERLAAQRAAQRPKRKGRILKNMVQYPEKTLDYHGNVLNRQASVFYRRHGVTRIDPAAETCIDLQGKQVMTTKYCIKDQLGLCPKSGKARVEEPFTLRDEEGHVLTLRFDCARCEMGVFLGEPKAVAQRK
ncbi:MAG TPA: U32 family peptidase [Armatimonadota bacterium]|jgi:putative protease